MKVLIIGGVAAGTKAAAKLKRMNPAADVTILTKGKDISYAGCGLPYYVGGLIPEKEQLIVNTPAKFTELTGAKVLVENEKLPLWMHPAKQLAAKNLRTGMEETYSYDECVSSHAVLLRSFLRFRAYLCQAYSPCAPRMTQSSSETMLSVPEQNVQ